MAPTTTAPVTPHAGFGAAVPREFLALADAVATDGLDRHAAGIHEFAAAARRRGVCPLLVAVLADAAEPAVARERALGRLLAAWVRPMRSSPAAAPVRDADVTGHATAA